ncbi:MAG: transporter substrate-binding domain-containing protein [Desulfopila sp.]|jgi:polar amino acid transport system substrate-binding protein|nr:transporter substrate-binding domain-containing protein [Desulfopila sp.]
MTIYGRQNIKRELQLVIIALVTLLSVQSGQASSSLPTEVTLVNDPYPPYVMPAGHPLGPGIDMEIALQVLKNLGIEVTVELMPFRRVLATLEAGQADMTTSLSFRKERDAYLLWSRPYRKDVRYIFFTRRDSSFNPQRLDDLSGKDVGMVSGFVFPPAFIENRDIRKTEAPHMESLVNMLLADRFDAIIVNSVVGRYQLQATGRMTEVKEAQFELVTPGSKGTVMAFSRARNHEELVRHFDQELERMLSDGAIERIVEKYLE